MQIDLFTSLLPLLLALAQASPYIEAILHICLV